MRCPGRIAAVALVLAGCATVPKAPPGHAACRADFLGHDARAAEAGVENAGAHRIAGFPYLRSDRFLASFAAEVDDGTRFTEWVERLRQLDLAARRSELRNTGWERPLEELAHLDRCGRDWASADLKDPERRKRLRERVAVPDDYSAGKRALGLYPLTAPFLRAGVRGYQREVQEDFASPLPAVSLKLWQAGSVWQDALVREQAPRWLIEEESEADRPGAIVDAGGQVDTASPATYVQEAFTRFHGRILRQLVYTTWFTERPKRRTADPYAGRLDAVVWRVTLDEHDRPLVYDTIHACGCYHYVFAAQPLHAREAGGFWQEMPLQPQLLLPAAPFAIRLQAGTHYVRRLVPLDARFEPRGQYQLRPYEDLLSLPDARGGRRSLFGPDGLVAGSERGERWWLWPTGVRSPGAMRQWGRHATAFVGRRHFDDPFLFEELFVIPKERSD